MELKQYKKASQSLFLLGGVPLSDHQKIVGMVHRIVAEQDSERIIVLCEELRKELAAEITRLKAKIAKKPG